ncbi:Uma2 family endonuclease [Thermus tengchongensis]|uniref:Uma2 family endonuclease n=1 Tax=Thermus tengchongensis TaxID=1214928 RepID=UPI00056E59AA|nr:Uma2 family endonuclease [Thermus tengchongensis]
MVRPYRFSLEEFLRLPLPERGVELLRGEIYQMAPIGPRHAYMVNRLNRLLVQTFPQALVQPQGPLALGEDTYLEPDLLLLRPKDYGGALPEPGDVLLLVEVAEASLAYDLEKKLPLYAEAGILEVWVVDLNASRLLVFRGPAGDHYREQLWLSPGEQLAPLAFPDIPLEVPW